MFYSISLKNRLKTRPLRIQKFKKLTNSKKIFNTRIKLDWPKNDCDWITQNQLVLKKITDCGFSGKNDIDNGTFSTQIQRQFERFSKVFVNFFL